MAYFHKIRTASNYSIVSLAATDISIGLIAPVALIFYLKENDEEMNKLCSPALTISRTICGLSITNVAAVAFDRYTAIKSPLTYSQLMSISRVVIVTFFCWIYAIILSCLPFIYSELVTNCEKNKTILIISLNLLFVPPVLVLLIVYFRIWKIVSVQLRAIEAVESAVLGPLEARQRSRNRKCAKTLTILLSVFILFWCPFRIVDILEISGIGPFSVNISMLLAVLSLICNVTNPWIFAFRTSDFRPAFMKLYRKFVKACDCQEVNSRSSSMTTFSSYDLPYTPNRSERSRSSITDLLYSLNRTRSRIYPTEVSQTL